MHYIRFLKPPRLLEEKNPALRAKITITTDLGEAFLTADITVLVELESELGKSIRSPSEGKEYKWKGSEGMRSLEVTVPLPKSRKGEHVRMFISAAGAGHSADFVDMVYATARPVLEQQHTSQVVAVRSIGIDTRHPELPGCEKKLAQRVFTLAKTVHIWEETGESIARHIWDAGVILSSYLVAISPLHNFTNIYPQTLPILPLLNHTLSRKSLNVLELGAGCGIVGVTLHTFYSNVSRMLLSDLPEASEILAKNVDDIPPSTRSITHEVLDWSAPLALHIRETRWDLVLVADCTYNPSTTPHLVSTLRGVAEGGGQAGAATMVLLAMKVRHDSEMVCFDMLAEVEFVVREKIALEVPTLPTEADEEIEVFLLTLKPPAEKAAQ